MRWLIISATKLNALIKRHLPRNSVILIMSLRYIRRLLFVQHLCATRSVPRKKKLICIIQTRATQQMTQGLFETISSPRRSRRNSSNDSLYLVLGTRFSRQIVYARICDAVSSFVHRGGRQVSLTARRLGSTSQIITKPQLFDSGHAFLLFVFDQLDMLMSYPIEVGSASPMLLVEMDLMEQISTLSESNLTRGLCLDVCEVAYSGAVHCQLMDSVHPGIEANKLVKGRPFNNLEFMQWMKRYCGGLPKSYNPLERREGSKGEETGKRTAPTQCSSKSWSATFKVHSSHSLQKNDSPPGNPAAKVARPTSSGGPAYDEKITSLKLTVDSLEKERGLYFTKLRDIEFPCQIPQVEYLPVVAAIHRILYATDDSVYVVAEAQAMQQEPLRPIIEVAEDKCRTENPKRKNIMALEVDVAVKGFLMLLMFIVEVLHFSCHELLELEAKDVRC